MTSRIDRRNLIEAFREGFPELESKYQEELEFWSGERAPSNYDFVGFIFKPQLKRELESGVITDFLSRSAEFIERVCDTNDQEAVNVIWIKVFEWLLPRPGELRLLWPVLGEKTKANIKDAACRWGYTLDSEEQSPHAVN
jgi:hypothetical protein